MNKREVAHALRTMGALLEVKGEDSFKVRSYERAAESLERHDFDLPAMAREGRLTEIPGIGKNLEPKVAELVLSGRSSFLERLVEEVPAGILELLRVPGIGPKTARLLHSSLGVASLPELDRALSEHRVQGLPGMGTKREELMRRGLSEIQRYAGRLSFGIALPVTEDLAATLESTGIRAEIVGETRRYEETVGSLDVLLQEAAGEEPWETLLRSGVLAVRDAESLRKSWDPASMKFEFATTFGIPLRVFFAPPAGFAAKSVWTTGPPPFVERLDREARERGYRLTSDGLYRGDCPFNAATSEELLAVLGVGYVPPEVRHRMEFVEPAFGPSPGEVARKVAALPDPEDIHGDLHLHTSWSDGTASIEDMVAAATGMGYRYVAVTDHATEIKMIRSMTPERLAAQTEEIRRLRPKYPAIRILTGVEVDILRDGRLYLDDDVLSKLDVVVASVHQDIGDSRGELVNRLTKAASNPNVDVLGHVTGRIIGRRPGVTGGLEGVLDAAARHGCALEVNSSPERLDLPQELAADALSRGAEFAVCTDAHSPGTLSSIRYGVYSVCRRAGIPKDRIVNARPFVPRS